MGGDRNLLPVPGYAPAIIRNDTGIDLCRPGRGHRPGGHRSHHRRRAPGRVPHGTGLQRQDTDSAGLRRLLRRAAAGLRRGSPRPACLSGVCEAWLYIPSGSESIEFADISSGSTAYLTSNAKGAAEILWAANDDSDGNHHYGLQWSLVRLPAAAA